MPTRDVVMPPDRHALYELHRYSPAIRANGLLFVSGQVGSRADGSPEPELDAQVRLAFQNLNAILAAAGCSFSDVIDVTVFMVDPQTHFERAWAVAAEYWGEAPYPTATAVGVTWLSGFSFEIKVIAKLPEAAMPH
ncbi:enamine deaminase RidA (YjgF/YER057c/UK114 family) [Variovorax sp. TBS-050B]|uniref:RidA family protein n=1 Tax=Variovorax sp. TBS-050B TaxID=2940551 RepID=UPI00247433DF|nr:RidA family protein [Variovorax sp. TBS-050B]MDH6593251.1 enamine deaminase RidA (YjgF/YER057c/UK114 family) [Variovorax sp. TBS-050B]